MPYSDRERELLRQLETFIAHLREDSRIDPATVEPSGRVDAAVRLWLQLAIQCCIDLGDYAVASLGEPEPRRSRDVFSILVRRSVISERVGATLERLTDHRNSLVHAYASLRPTQTWTWVRDGLPAIAEFADAMRAWEAKQGSSEGRQP